MHDIRAIRADPAGFDAALARRGLPACAEAVVQMDAERRAALATQQEQQGRRNALAKEIGQGKRAGAGTAALEAEATRVREAMAALEERAAGLDGAVRERLEGLPNVLDAEVPEGKDETANVVLKQHGEVRDPGFAAREHFDLGEGRGEMLFEAAARMSGSRFTILQGGLARMERALGAVYVEHARGEARVSGDFGAADGERCGGLWDGQATEVCGGFVPDDGWAVAHPDGGGAFDQSGDGSGGAGGGVADPGDGIERVFSE